MSPSKGLIARPSMVLPSNEEPCASPLARIWASDIATAPGIILMGMRDMISILMSSLSQASGKEGRIEMQLLSMKMSVPIFLKLTSVKDE